MASSRKIGLSIGGIIILVIGVISFIVAPVLSKTGSAGPDSLVIGSWDKIKINTEQDSPFIEKYRYLNQYVDSQNMMPKEPQQQRFFQNQVLRLAFNMAVFEIAMQDSLRKAGYEVPEFRVKKELVNYYLDENGYYSQAKYEKTSKARKLELQKSMTEYLAINRYIEDLFGNSTNYGLKTSSKESDFIVDMAKKEKSFKYVSFNSSTYPAEEVVKYGKAHKDLFTAYNLSLLTYTTEDTAKKALASIKAGELSFDDAVILNTPKVITDENGKLTYNYRTDINKYFPDNENLKIVLALKTEELSPVVALHNGMFAIVRCDAEPTEANFESEETITKIRNYINVTEKGMVEDYLLKEAKKFSELAKKDGFDTVAESFNGKTLTVETSNSFPINYGNTAFLQPIPSQGVLYSISENEDFFKTAFSLKENEVSKPLLIASEVLVLQLNEEKDADEYTLENTKKGYTNQADSWFAYYYAAQLLRMQGMNYPLPVSQKTFMDYILTNAKFVDNFAEILK